MRIVKLWVVVTQLLILSCSNNKKVIEEPYRVILGEDETILYKEKKILIEDLKYKVESIPISDGYYNNYYLIKVLNKNKKRYDSVKVRSSLIENDESGFRAEYRFLTPPIYKIVNNILIVKDRYHNGDCNGVLTHFFELSDHIRYVGFLETLNLAAQYDTLKMVAINDNLTRIDIYGKKNVSDRDSILVKDSLLIQ